jgi:hypothetical protein
MTQRIFAVICLLAVLLVPRLAAAQEPSPEAVAAARELVSVSRAADHMKAMMPAIMQALKPAIVQGRAEVAREYDVLAPALMKIMGARLGEFVDQVAIIYARMLTVGEMKELTAFYRGPLGQKLLDKMPAIALQTGAAGQAFGKQIGGELKARMIEELKKKGLKI